MRRWYDLAPSFVIVAEKGVRALEDASVEVSTIHYESVLADGFFDNGEELEAICFIRDVIATAVFPERKKSFGSVRQFLNTRKSK